MCCRQKWNGNIFFISTYFSLKEAKKEPKGQTKLLRPANVRLGQKKPKGQQKFFRPNNLKRGQFQPFGLKNASLATLGHYAAR